ncbi:hypothetical protein [Glycomyces sp. NPDC021274]|uniref:hypothetical protein n=1 Tax=Glycomyces sp. NPDC021274 TaxID=3155120 RepID=UPI0033C106E2
MKLKHFGKTASALVSAGVLAGSFALASPALAAVETIPINDGNVPTTAKGFEDQSCDNIPPDDISKTEDGWVFVLPASAGAEGNFISVTATFENANGDERIRNTDDHGGIVSGSGDNKAYIITPPGWTLVDAEAEVEDPDDDAFFNLTHTCPGKPRGGMPSPR